MDGPLFDDLAVGDSFAGAPRIVLSSGLAATHHAIVGGRLRLVLDPELSARVTGLDAPLASPALVWDLAIGQSTEVTQRGIANLFYRGLAFQRMPALGDILYTRTTITGLRTAASKPGRPPRGLVVMRIVTHDQHGREVLDFHRCALLPARSDSPGPAMGELEPPAPHREPGAAVRNWDLAAFHAAVPGPHFEHLAEGARFAPAGGDVVSSAPELARLSLNLAAIHHDRTATGSGERLVYGGHTIGLAAAQASRVLPAMVTILGWDSCDHLGPVREGDTLHSEITLLTRTPLPAGGGLALIRSRVSATGSSGPAREVLDWRFSALFA